ncbi:MurR/RpiR family transcriptional regulator [Spiroplasma gladiatoris]|uniref:MurR/RpiR family transcriptional regulator n=1 Tax=Spiroplasma gladiatoris TaxID=2143 RepID=A0A4P7AHW7_9MOLU|nr:hypothetical protein [Spiroplasma gladiatoris]QBQ07837.1 MurR/RpiR family transcriptional regulator [Spiroplasma gladiatoris]
MNLREKLILVLKETHNQLKIVIINNLLECFDKNIFLPIQTISNNCFVSKSAISKFCNKLGFTGYRELVSRLKFERENYLNILDNKMEIKSYDDTKNYFINCISFFDNYKEKLLTIAELIKNDTYIVASNQLINQAKILYFYLNKKGYKVFFTEMLVANYNLDINLKNSTVLFLVGGMEVGGIFNVYHKIKYNNNIIFLTSTALSTRIDKCEVKIIFDLNNSSTSYYLRSVLVGYLIAQIINIVN